MPGTAGNCRSYRAPFGIFCDTFCNCGGKNLRSNSEECPARFDSFKSAVSAMSPLVIRSLVITNKWDIATTPTSLELAGLGQSSQRSRRIGKLFCFNSHLLSQR